MPLNAGTYYIGVSSTGNLGYNPALSDTGIDGTTQGDYELHLNFTPKFFADAAGAAVDANVDGVPGGTFRYSFQSRPVLAGDYILRDGTSGGVHTRIEQSGNTLTFVNGSGASSVGTFVGASQVVDVGSGSRVGNVTSAGIEWSDGTTWYFSGSGSGLQNGGSGSSGSASGGSGASGAAAAAGTASFQLVQILPNIDGPLQDNDIRQTAPNELVFRFSPGEAIDPTSLSGIQIVRSGFDGVFDNGNDVLVAPGYVGIGDQPYEVIFRFAENLPDDDYRITILGAPTTFTSSTYLVDSTFVPPDAIGAVGLDHIVETINGNFQIFDKTTGISLQSTTLDQFWIDAGVTLQSGTVDPRIIYDPTVDRWFASAIDFESSTANNIYVAVSISGDPTAGWTGFSFVGDTSPDNRFNDFDTLGIDADGVYLSTNNFGGPLGFDISLYSIPKADLLAAVPTIVNLSRFENLDPAVFGGSFLPSPSFQPAVDFGPSDGRARCCPHRRAASSRGTTSSERERPARRFRRR